MYTVDIIANTTIKSHTTFVLASFHSVRSSTTQVKAEGEVAVFQCRMLLETQEVFQEVELQTDVLNIG